MFKITVEVWPYGRQPDGAPQVELACYNDGRSPSATRGNYNVMVMQAHEAPIETYQRYLDTDLDYELEVKGYPREDNQNHLAGLAGLILDRYAYGDGSPALCWDMQDEA